MAFLKLELIFEPAELIPTSRPSHELHRSPRTILPVYTHSCKCYSTTLKYKEIGKVNLKNLFNSTQTKYFHSMYNYYKIIKIVYIIFFFTKFFKIQCVSHTCIASQFRPTTFQVLSSRVWLPHWPAQARMFSPYIFAWLAPSHSGLCPEMPFLAVLFKPATFRS